MPRLTITCHLLLPKFHQPPVPPHSPTLMAAQLRHNFLPSAAVVAAGIRHRPSPFCLRLPSLPRPSSPLSLLRPFSSNPNLPHPTTAPLFGGGGGNIKPPPGGSGGGGSDNHGSDEPSDPPSPFDFFLTGWRSRVSADPQFPFKVLMEQLVGVTACVLGDMASRPNFGLNELDFVFSTLVVGSILNFVLMYLLAPTAAAASVSTSALPSYMFEPGAYSLLSRMGAFAYKGVVFAGVGFTAGIAGTMLSNGLMAMRKRMDPTFETPNAPPPTLLNAMTWALHMGLSSNVRYQTLNGVEFVLGKALPPVGFKTSVVVLRVLNNVLGGVSFVALARLTGSQKAAGKGEEKEKERMVGDGPAVEAIAVLKGGDEELRRGEDRSSK